MLLSSAKFESKAKEVLKEGLDKTPILAMVEKKRNGSQSSDQIELVDSGHTRSGMMLYTSGTTSRPVS